jgi:hypothetical protein
VATNFSETPKPGTNQITKFFQGETSTKDDKKLNSTSLEQIVEPTKRTSNPTNNQTKKVSTKANSSKKRKPAPLPSNTLLSYFDKHKKK